MVPCARPCAMLYTCASSKPKTLFFHIQYYFSYPICSVYTESKTGYHSPTPTSIFFLLYIVFPSYVRILSLFCFCSPLSLVLVCSMLTYYCFIRVAATGVGQREQVIIIISNNNNATTTIIITRTSNNNTKEIFPP